jgi:AcrR family transcriptional regulator
MSSKAVTKSRLNSEDRRASIVNAAGQLFASKGFSGTTTRELAAAVGVTEPVLYEHFKTKRDLYSAIIETKAQAGIDALSSLVREFADKEDDRAFFQKLGITIAHWYTDDPTFARLLLYSNLEGHELKDLFHERSRACFTILSEYLTRRIEQGAIRPVDPLLASRAFFGMIAHYSLTALIFGFAPLPRPVDQVVTEMTDIFMIGICQQDMK